MEVANLEGAIEEVGYREGVALLDGEVEEERLAKLHE